MPLLRTADPHPATLRAVFCPMTMARAMMTAATEQSLRNAGQPLQPGLGSAGRRRNRASTALTLPRRGVSLPLRQPATARGETLSALGPKRLAVSTGCPGNDACAAASADMAQEGWRTAFPVLQAGRQLSATLTGRQLPLTLPVGCGVCAGLRRCAGRNGPSAGRRAATGVTQIVKAGFRLQRRDRRVAQDIRLPLDESLPRLPADGPSA
ncbi:MAG: hypothetical protein ACI4O7_07475 [Aristaeellaceae bacterium]